MATGGDLLHLDQQICFALYAASRAASCAYQPLLEELGVTYPQYLVLLVLWEKDGLRVSQIGERLFLDSATLTPLLKRLEAQGLVDRRRSAEDERAVEVHLTAEGEKLKKRAAAIPRALFAKTGLSTSESVTLRRALQKLTQTLRRDADEPPT